MHLNKKKKKKKDWRCKVKFQKFAQARTSSVISYSRTVAVYFRTVSLRRGVGQPRNEIDALFLHVAKDSIIIIVRMSVTTAKIDVIISTVSQLAVRVAHPCCPFIGHFVRKRRVEGYRWEKAWG